MGWIYLSMYKVQTHQLKVIQEISVRGAIWFLIILFLSSPSCSLFTGLWDNQEVYTILENFGENEERNENQDPKNGDGENKTVEFLLFTNLQAFIFRDLASFMSKSGSWKYCTINSDVLTPPPEFKEFTTV